MYESSLLIGTETFHKAGAPHMVATIVSNSNAIEREEQYKDVVGFYKYEDKDTKLERLHEDMIGWVSILNKNMIFIFKQDKKLLGWLYFKNEGKVDFREVQIYSNNNVNYDIWLDPETSFWNPVDFLLEAEYFEHAAAEASENTAQNEKVDALAKKIEVLNSTMLQLAWAIKELLQLQRKTDKGIT